MVAPLFDSLELFLCKAVVLPLLTNTLAFALLLLLALLLLAFRRLIHQRVDILLHTLPSAKLRTLLVNHLLDAMKRR